ncbi:GNAT family N-acetyltransferase [Daejeonella sp.]|uniref:GNAT family N-acetyltransferase n=1 Tax=Daejeonella sp. TaxID=2805397 RepID=UPI003983CB62
MIKLEYFTSEDFDALLSWIQDEELLLHWAGTQFRFPLNEKKLEWYIKDTNDFQASSTLIYKAIESESGKTIGHISLTSINRTNRSARITRVFVADSERGKGLAANMVIALLKIGFEELHLHRVSLGVYHKNESAIKCYKNCGFNIDGVLRDIQRYKDGYWSLMEMSILEHEWGVIGGGKPEVGNPSDLRHQTPDLRPQV